MKPDATATEPAAAQPAVNKERGQRQVCTGLYTPPMGSKVHEVTLDVGRYRQDLALAEVHLTGFGETQRLEGHKLFFRGWETKHELGVGVLVRKQVGEAVMLVPYPEISVRVTAITTAYHLGERSHHLPWGREGGTVLQSAGRRYKKGTSPHDRGEEIVKGFITLSRKVRARTIKQIFNSRVLI